MDKLPQAPGTLLLRGLQQCVLFRNWPSPLLAELAPFSQLKCHPRDAQLTFGLSELLVIVSGSIEVSGSNPTGDKFVLSVLGSGEITGLVTLLDDTEFESSYSYRVREEAWVIHLPSAALHDKLDTNPILWRDVAFEALKRQKMNMIHMERRALATISQRTGQALMRLAQLSGRPTGDGKIKLRISQSDLAAMISASRQTVNQELGMLVKKNVISLKYGEVTICDVKAMRNLADIGTLEDSD
jgi:CRP/FNR family transcriptional regulator, cyclic AMP receptor protein